MLSIADRLLDEARRRGVRLWADSDLLRFDGPEAALDDRFLGLVRHHRRPLLELLSAGTGPATRLVPPEGEWLKPLVADGAPRVLFVVPAAGSGPSVFRPWRAAPPPGTDLVVVHLPGREMRLGEQPYTELNPLAERIAESIRGFDERPFAIFGHSVGALIAHEVAKRVAGPALRALFVAGSPPPDSADVSGAQASDDELLEALAAWAGTPAQLLADRTALTAFLPCLRADLKVGASARRPFTDDEQVNVPIISLAGANDTSLAVDETTAWANWTSGEFVSHIVAGGHFFPVTAVRPVLDRVTEALSVFA